MNLFFLALLLAWPGRLAMAAGETPDFQVEVDPKVYPPGEFKAKGVKSSPIPERRKRADALPEKRQREAVFARVPGLESEVSGMDELDRDLLFVRAKSYPLKELERIYPKMDPVKLRRLKTESAR